MSERSMLAEEYVATVAGKAKKSKYSNVKTVIDGITFDSKAEARRYSELKILLDNRNIAHLVLQPRYPLVVEGIKITTYVGDFRYLNIATNDVILEDVKGMKTPIYRMKKKLVKALYQIDIVEVTA